MAAAAPSNGLPMGSDNTTLGPYNPVPYNPAPYNNGAYDYMPPAAPVAGALAYAVPASTTPRIPHLEYHTSNITPL